MDINSYLQVSYQEIKTQLEAVFELIEQRATSITSVVYQLPPPQNDEIGTQPETIPVASFEDDAAYRMAKYHYFRFKISLERSGRILPRMPGVIMIDHPDHKECLERLHAINVAKLAFKALVSGISTDKNERFTVVSQAIPDLVKLQMFRQLLFVDAPVKKIGFTWAHRHSMKRLKKDDVLALLAVTDKYYKKRQPLSDFRQIVEKEQRYIASFNDKSRFIIRRPLRCTPMMNLRYETPKLGLMVAHKNPNNLVAHSPLLLLNHHPDVGGLKSYVKPMVETELNPLEAVIPRLYLYEHSS